MVHRPATYAARLNVQRFHHLTVDGVYGPITHDAMVWSIGYSSHLGCAAFTG